MPRIAIDEIDLDVPDKAYLTWLGGILVGPFHVLGLFLWCDQTGFPRTGQRFVPVLSHCISNLKQGITVIDDPQIRPGAKNALRALLAFQSARQRLLDWVGENVSRYAIAKHRREDIRTASMTIPKWVSNPGYRMALAKSSREYSRYLDALANLVPILELKAAEADLKTDELDLGRVKAQIPQLRKMLELGVVDGFRTLAETDTSSSA